MTGITNDATLQLAILKLKQQRREQAQDLKDHWNKTKEELSPMNLLKDGVKDTFSSPDFRSGLIKGALSLATGFLTKRLIVGNSGGAVRKLVGTLAQTGATSLAFKKSDEFVDKGGSWLSGFLKKLKIKN